MRRGIESLAVLAAALALVVGLTFGYSTTLAQEGTPSPEVTEHSHPAHIHTGTCDAVGDVVFPLENLVAPDASGTPAAAVDEEDDDAQATPAGDMAETEDDGGDEVLAESTTTITATFDELTSGEHVINVHESEANIGNYIACGAVTGTPSDEGELEFDLDELNGSGYEGEAELYDNGDGTIEVTVRLMHVDEGTPVASPTA